MTFKIAYKFKDEEKWYSCSLTHNQYKNFKELPTIIDCKIIKDDQKNVQDYKEEMQEAINLAVKNNTTHIRKLSEML